MSRYKAKYYFLTISVYSIHDNNIIKKKRKEKTSSIMKMFFRNLYELQLSEGMQLKYPVSLKLSLMFQ